MIGIYAVSLYIFHADMQTTMKRASGLLIQNVTMQKSYWSTYKNYKKGASTMSTTGHYTRYINQFPGWSDNCDTMHRTLWDGDPAKLRGGLYFTAKKTGSLTVEHYPKNIHAYCYFDNWDGISSKYGYHIREHIYDYSGKLAIQNVLTNIEKMDMDTIISDVIFKHLNFYKYAYLDYIDRINNKEKYLPYPPLSDINSRLECDLPCVLSECRFTCNYMTAGTCSGNCYSDKNPVCKYFAAWLGTVNVNV